MTTTIWQRQCLYICCILSLSLAVEFTTANVDVERNLLRGLQYKTTAPKLTPEARIIGGTEVEASDDRYPYYTMLWGQGLCGGALITPSIAITAAHCLNADDEVVAGIQSRITGESDYEIIPIETKLIHPDYDSDDFPNDVLILKLETPSTKPYVKVNNNVTQPIVGDELWVIGFGDTNPGNGLNIPTVLNEVDLEYVSNTYCKQKHGNVVEDDMMCATASGKDACSGDSGGPLIVRGETSEEDVLVGTVSWGRGCANDRYPGVYSRMSYFYDWIVETVCDLSPNDAPEYMNCTGSGVSFAALTAPPTFVPTSAPTVLTPMPSSSPTPSPTKAPTSSPSEATVTSDTGSLPDLEWIGWNADTLQVCQGDCDSDSDCEGDLICFQRSKGQEVPGCNNISLGDNTRDQFGDICMNP